MSAPVTVLEHDPDSGCAKCPLRAGSVKCRAAGGRWFDDPSMSGSHWTTSAPDWCPLRRGTVEVRRG